MAENKSMSQEQVEAAYRKKSQADLFEWKKKQIADSAAKPERDRQAAIAKANEERKKAAEAAADQAKKKKEERAAKVDAAAKTAMAAGKAGVDTAKAVGGVAKDGLMTGIATAKMGKDIGGSLINPHGSGLIITLLAVHLLKWLMFGPKSGEADPFFGVRLSIDIFMFFYFWLVFFKGTSSLKQLGVGFVFAFILFCFESIGLDGMLGYIAPALITGSMTHKLFMPIFWPWYFYVAVWTSSSEDFIANLSKIGTILLVAFVVTQSFIPGFLEQTAQKYGLGRSTNIAEATDVAESQPMGYWRASLACIQEKKWEDMDGCRSAKMFPPKDEQGLSSGAYKKEPMIITLSDDILFAKDSVTRNFESNFLLNIISPRKAVDVEFACQITGRKQKTPCISNIFPNKFLNDTKITVPPEKFSCVPGNCDIGEAGDYTFTVKADIKNIVTESSLESLFVGKDVLDGYIMDYSDPKNKNAQIWSDLNGDGTIDGSEMQRGDALLLSLEKKWFPELESKIGSAYVNGVVGSQSDPDLSQLALSIGDAILNKGIVGSQFELSVGLKNTKENSNIVDISLLEITLPEGTKIVITNCDGFKLSDKVKNVIGLDASYLNSVKSKLSNIDKAFKAVRIASCVIEIDSANFLENPNKVESKFFSGKVVYSQQLTKDFKVTKEVEDLSVIVIDVALAKERNSVVAAKVVEIARRLGVDEKVALAVATLESELRQYYDSGKIVTNGADWGVMQINEKAHSSEGCFSAYSAKSGICKTDSCSGTSVLDSVDCNIEAGILLLKQCYEEGKKYPDGLLFGCNNKVYSGWDYALRCYNGWTNDCTKGNLAYVESVNTGIAGVAVASASAAPTGAPIS